jgi:UDP-2,3-diacylglucosamine diphosphatase
LQICICKQKNRRSPPVFCVFTGRSPQADALYILGDLFEAWIGDDDPNPLHQQIASAIKALVDSGVPATSSGNRDFLVGQRFARESGMILLPEEECSTSMAASLIMHGDTLCTDDQAIWRFAPKSTPRGSSVCSWPCRCLSAAASPPECAPTAKPPTAANRWKLWM